MPFGCVASGANFLPVEAMPAARPSPMPFGCVASGARAAVDKTVRTLLSLQCLSAVWLLVPCMSASNRPQRTKGLQCLSAVWLLVPSETALRALERVKCLQCLSAVWLLVPIKSIISTFSKATLVSNAFRLCGFWCRLKRSKSAYWLSCLQCLSAVWLLVPRHRGEWTD